MDRSIPDLPETTCRRKLCYGATMFIAAHHVSGLGGALPLAFVGGARPSAESDQLYATLQIQYGRRILDEASDGSETIRLLDCLVVEKDWLRSLTRLWCLASPARLDIPGVLAQRAFRLRGIGRAVLGAAADRLLGAGPSYEAALQANVRAASTQAPPKKADIERIVQELREALYSPSRTFSDAMAAGMYGLLADLAIAEAFERGKLLPTWQAEALVTLVYESYLAHIAMVALTEKDPAPPLLPPERRIDEATIDAELAAWDRKMHSIHRAADIAFDGGAGVFELGERPHEHD